MTSHTNGQSVASARLTVHSHRGDASTYELAAGDMLLVGSGASCGVVLQDADIAAMHCTLSLVDGTVRVRDWNTSSGTYVGGQKVDFEMSVPFDMDIKVGSYRIEVDLDEPSAETSAIETLDKVDSLLNEATSSAASEPQPVESRAEVFSEEPAEQPITVERNEPEFDDFDFQLESSNDDKCEAYDTSAFDDDTLELMKAEVELLQSELAERDARLAELESLADIDGNLGDSFDAGDSPEVDRLVERLEQLLDELERSDERMSTMADLLRTADDANAAEIEERRQIESWISEIERRLTERESERQAEKQVLETAVADLTKQLKRAEQQLEQTGSEQAAGEANNQYLSQMRQEYETLKQRLQDSETARESLREQLESADVKNAEARTQAAIEEALREERLAIAQERTQFSQERAALAREKSELDRIKDKLEEERQKLEADPDSADQRIRAFRDHLREIHDTTPAVVQPQGLSSRIGRLWRRIEGRPLDTDS